MDTPLRPDLDVMAIDSPVIIQEPVVGSDWRKGLPVLSAEHVSLRELRMTDAPSLFTLLTVDEVARFISPPPPTVEGFERFIAWTHRQRSVGAYVCFAITLRGFDTAIGVFQIRQLEPTFQTAEWGFALGSAFWGTGLFQEGAELALQFTFDTLGVHRLEARAAMQNGRGNGALAKIGAIQEAILRKSFLRNGVWLDQLLYSIIAADWREARTPRRLPACARIH